MGSRWVKFAIRAGAQSQRTLSWWESFYGCLVGYFKPTMPMGLLSLPIYDAIYTNPLGVKF